MSEPMTFEQFNRAMEALGFKRDEQDRWIGLRLKTPEGSPEALKKPVKSPLRTALPPIK